MAPSTPSIRVYDHGAPRFAFGHNAPSPRSGAMSIPRARVDDVPPPLPPDRYIGEQLNQGEDIAWKFGNTNNRGYSNVQPGSSLLGGYSRRSGSTSLDDMSPESFDGHSDEERGQSRPTLPNPRLTSERQLSQKAVEHSSQAYDKQLLSKIGCPGSNPPNTPTRTTAPALSVSAQDISTMSRRQLNGELKPLSVPDRLPPSIESPGSRWPPSGTLSPGFSGFRSPPPDSELHARRFGSISSPGTLDESIPPWQHRGSYDHSIYSDSEVVMTDSGIRELNINDPSPAGSDEYQSVNKAGQKRRASSPPSDITREDGATGIGHAQLYHRRSAQKLMGRNSPVVSRFQQANPGSLSSVSSLGQRNASFASSYTFSGASSMTSYNGDQRPSPNALSPSTEAEVGSLSPYSATRSLDPSPRGSVSRPLQRGLSDLEHLQLRKLSTDSSLHSRQNSVTSRVGGAYTCDCCPKKPKKFDTEEQLRVHEMEKQYTCQYCPNRFKNKNEAERHQNSLHLRRHSWSCATLAGVQAAFYPSPSHTGSNDVCGYCGADFPNPPNWEDRSNHLNHVHKFGECNKGKKFYRADHFRQHLKHSHAGTSGRWTNMLENACMRDEAQEPVGSFGTIGGSSVTSPLAPKPSIIDEEHE